MRPVLIVTGAGRGIGAAVARKAAARGYAVAVNYQRDAQSAEALVREIAAAGGEALAIQADIGQAEEVERLFARATGELGAPAALVNNAGITGRIGPFMDADPASIETVFRTNVHGTMHCSRAAVRSFRASGTRGVIVNLSSVAASTGSPGEYVHYAASKAAVEAFTLGLARELAPEGIRVCAVAPGSTLTDIHAAAGEPGRPARVAPKIPMQRLATPEEIAEPVLWLLSPAASYVTGTTLRCGGGL
ncbi:MULTISPECIES: SDR family oxidoreductase [unclassified Massilia]|uniref:SDR family oxidoreductase n=1 Tax=unclassified Massilia TaxID=2609279 RepID=UPI001B83FD3E|nr:MULTISPECIES: SDR family oxidoreductase [unclassified Massilia]MBQ5940900.1 SDR family oxidoreductase [Massilia sp. AB1]MBQ5964561.1 SDR family oxidoreductase [Massilia sp. ZL223]